MICYLELQLHNTIKHRNRARHMHVRSCRRMVLLLLQRLHGLLKDAAHMFR